MTSETLHQRKSGNVTEMYNEPPPPYPGNAYYNQTDANTNAKGLPSKYPSPAHGSPVVYIQRHLDEDPVRLNCPYCNHDIITSIRYKNGSATWLASAFMCIVGMYLGCCLIPFCVKGSKDVIHSCPDCKSVIGRYSRLNGNCK